MAQVSTLYDPPSAGVAMLDCPEIVLPVMAPVPSVPGRCEVEHEACIARGAHCVTSLAGVTITHPQVRRLLESTGTSCDRVIEALVDRGLLVPCDDAGGYVVRRGGTSWDDLGYR